MKQYTLDMSQSAPCQHQAVRVELTPSGPHYGKRLCATCGKFMGWEPNPEVTSQSEGRDGIITQLLRDGVTEWEQSFLASVKGKRFLTPKQLACFDKIVAQYR